MPPYGGRICTASQHRDGLALGRACCLDVPLCRGQRSALSELLHISKSTTGRGAFHRQSIGHCHLVLVLLDDGKGTTTAWDHRNPRKSLWNKADDRRGQQDAINRILINEGKFSLTNARAELNHWRAHLVKTVHKGTPRATAVRSGRALQWIFCRPRRS